MFRIAQQALTNARQHARAKAITVLLKATKQYVTLSVFDDGIGFDEHNIALGHHGIAGMRERAQAMGGTLRITTHPRKGTRLTVRVPAR